VPPAAEAQADPPPAVAPAAAPTPLPRVVSAPPTPALPQPTAPAAPPAAGAPAVERAAAAASAPRALTLAQLTPEQRRDWPRLAIGGVVHSDNAASRFVVIDGRLVHEGEEAAPGLTVERIGAKAAILRWRGLRVELPY
jgi:general secretion pathway protein B